MSATGRRCSVMAGTQARGCAPGPDPALCVTASAVDRGCGDTEPWRLRRAGDSVAHGVTRRLTGRAVDGCLPLHRRRGRGDHVPADAAREVVGAADGVAV